MGFESYLNFFLKLFLILKFLLNTSIAEAKNPVLMAEAMKHAVIAGRKAFKAGRMKKRKYGSASSPQGNLI